MQEEEATQTINCLYIIYTHVDERLEKPRARVELPLGVLVEEGHGLVSWLFLI